MRNLIYRGTPPVGPAETQALLASEFAAIWSPPMYRHASAAEGDRVALVWQEKTEDPQLLGWGSLIFAPERNASWTNASAPGIVEAARAKGYGGPTNMAFLRLRGVQIASSCPPISGLGNVPAGLSIATDDQVAALALVAWGVGPDLPTRGRNDAADR
jgi:hypothetical protein